jgi:thymidylate synthase
MPYDVFLFTFLQELMAVELGVQLGAYHHFAASMHIYARHLELATRVLDEETEIAASMPPLESSGQKGDFCEFERRVREGCAANPDRLANYWREMAEVLMAFAESHRSWKKRLLAVSPANRYLKIFGFTDLLAAAT